MYFGSGLLYISLCQCSYILILWSQSAPYCSSNSIIYKSLTSSYFCDNTISIAVWLSSAFPKISEKAYGNFWQEGISSVKFPPTVFIPINALLLVFTNEEKLINFRFFLTIWVFTLHITPCFRSANRRTRLLDVPCKHRYERLFHAGCSSSVIQ